jgi:hypothetical protein
MANFLIVPTTEAPSQTITTTLAGQNCQINLYTKSINWPLASVGNIDIQPPTYQNINPCFIDLYSNDELIIGGVYVRQGQVVVIDTYLGFDGDLAVLDSTGLGEDPYGVPYRLPPRYLRNQWQQALPPGYGDVAPPTIAGRIPGMGSRWLLAYWPVGSYTPGYSLPPVDLANYSFSSADVISGGDS